MHLHNHSAERHWLRELGGLSVKIKWPRLAILISLGILTLFTGTVSAGGEAFLISPAQPESSIESVSDVQESAREMLRSMQEGERIRVIVQLNTSFVPEGKIGGGAGIRDQRAVIARGQDHVEKTMGSGSREIHRFRTIPLVVLEVDAAGLTALMNDPNVRSIRQDKPVPPALDEVIPYVGADQVWLEGVEAAGQTVAVLDTGVDTAHSFLAGKTVSEACYSTTDTFMGSASICPDGDNPTGADSQVGAGAGVYCDLSIDGCDHGTHVAGIAVGEGTDSGVAPGADLIAIQIFSEFTGTLCTGSGASSPCALSYTSDQIRGLERVYELRETYSIAAVNMSLGGDLYTDQTACDTAETDLKYIIDQLRSVGIAVVVSAGNGAARDGLSSPACISSAISVGSVDLSDNVSSFSNSADFLDFYAPGSAVYSSLPGDTFGNKSGTSMAAPEVAGAFALLKSAFPEASVDELYSAMADTGVLVDDLRSGGTVTEIPRIQLNDAYYSLIPTVFDDVAANHWAVEYIEALYDAGYVSGCSSDPILYCPDGNMTRGEGAVFVERGIHGGGYLPEQPTITDFDDVDLEIWYAKWAQALYDDGYTAGCGTDPLIFCPEDGHTRAEGAVFYLRMLNGPSYMPTQPTETVFADVDLEEWYAKWVEEAYAQGIYLPCQTEPELLACPGDPLLRDVAAYMMVQAKGGLPLE